MSDLLTQFNLYKKSTKIFLDWLGANVDNGASPQQFHTTSSIVEAARKVSVSHAKVPTFVITALRDAIKQRWVVFREFAKINSEMENNVEYEERRAKDERHKAFIMRLQEVLDLLLPLQDRTREQFPVDFTRSKDSNFFEPLETIEIEDSAGHEQDDLDMESTSKNPRALTDIEQPTHIVNMLFKDDEFEEYIILSFLMTELDTLLAKIAAYWDQAKTKQLPVVVAAWLCTTVIHASMRIFAGYSSIASDYDILVNKWFYHRQIWPVRLRFKDVPQFVSEHGACSDVVVLFYLGRMIQDCRTGEEYKILISNAHGRQAPASFIPKLPIPLSSISEFDCALDCMQESMRMDLVQEREIARIEPGGIENCCEPLLPLLKLATSKTQDPIPFGLVIGYEILRLSWEKFFWLDGKPNSQNCRLMALKLALEIKKEVRKTSESAPFSCKCKTCSLKMLQFNLNLTESNLDQYVSETRFDLYYQAPWTAGCHMIELLTYATYYGLNLCLESGVVCSVLHLYNALTIIDRSLPRVKILDKLLDLFKENIFLGSYPKTNFSSCFRRALGGRRIKSTEMQTRHSNLELRMKGKSEGPIKRGGSIFYDMHNTHYKTPMDIWERVHNGGTKKKFTRKEELEYEMELRSMPFVVHLERLKDTVIREFIGEMPTARLNYFAIHSFCGSLMATIQQAVGHDGAPHGIELVDDLLGIITKRVEDKSGKAEPKDLYSLSLVKASFGELVDAEVPKNFTWQI